MTMWTDISIFIGVVYVVGWIILTTVRIIDVLDLISEIRYDDARYEGRTKEQRQHDAQTVLMALQAAVFTPPLWPLTLLNYILNLRAQARGEEV